MKIKEIEDFRNDFKNIVYQKSLIEHNKKHLGDLHAYDKNDSHKGTILRSLERRDKLKTEMIILLKGKTYEDWQTTSKRLSVLSQRYKRASEQKSKMEQEINNLSF